jgi:hypothetical protein
LCFWKLHILAVWFYKNHLTVFDGTRKINKGVYGVLDRRRDSLSEDITRLYDNRTSHVYSSI